MNIYRHTFSAPCPNNSMSVRYSIEIRTTWVIMVEEIVAECLKAQQAPKPYHETIADQLYAKFGGEQIMTAFHHGVGIETRRGG